MKICGKNVWPENDSFHDVRGDFEMEKANFPDNKLLYVNQPLLTVETRENILYADFFILGQSGDAAPNTPADVDIYVCAAEVKVIRSLYDLETGDCKGLKNTICLINVRGDQDEMFSNCGFNEKKSKVPYCSQEKTISNAFSRTVFNKYNNKLLIKKTENCLSPSMEKKK